MHRGSLESAAVVIQNVGIWNETIHLADRRSSSARRLRDRRQEVDLEEEFADRCASRGYVSGSPEFKKCVDDERQIRLVKRSAGAVY